MKLVFEDKKILTESSDRAEEFADLIDLLYNNHIDLSDIEQLLDKYADSTDEAFDMATEDEQELAMKLAQRKKKELEHRNYVDEIFDLIDECSQLAEEESWINLQLAAKKLMNKAKRLSMIY